MNKKLIAAIGIPAIGLGIGLSACGSSYHASASHVSQRVSEAQQFARWQSGPGGAADRAIATDLGNLSTDAGNQNVSALNSDAMQLQTDIQTAEAAPAPPIGAADYQAALTQFDNAASQVQAQNYSGATQSVQQGTQDINAALAQVKADGGS